MLVSLMLALLVAAVRGGGETRQWPPFSIAALNMFRSDRSFWNRTLLEKKISFLLVKKSWRPYGMEGEDVVSEFPGSPKAAFEILINKTDRYQYLEQPLETCEHLFTGRNEEGVTEYDANLDSIFIVHGMNGDPFYTFPLNTVKALYMRNLQKKYNIFLVNWSKLNMQIKVSICRMTWKLKTKIEYLSAPLAELIMRGVRGRHWNPRQIHLVGLSYSGHLLGYIGRQVEAVFGDKVGSIFALDPASSDYNSHVIHLSREDALLVHAIHTNSLFAGTKSRRATADFIVNGGSWQPECRTILKNPLMCSHMMAVPRFWYMILFPRIFQARLCGSWKSFKSCDCDGKEGTNIQYPIENSEARGVYQLTTMRHHPYGLGEAGSKCPQRIKKKRAKDTS